MEMALFVVSMVSTIVNLFRLVSIMNGHSISFPFALTKIWVMVPSFAYQTYFWADLFRVALGIA